MPVETEKASDAAARSQCVGHDVVVVGQEHIQ